MEITSAQICEDILALMKHVKPHLFELAETQDLTPAQMSALYAISHGEDTMGRVACSLHCDASNVTGIVDRLVAQQLVKRHESKHDRRTKILELTPKGQHTVDAVMNKLPDYIGCDRLSESERSSLHTIINKIAS